MDYQIRNFSRNIIDYTTQKNLLAAYSDLRTSLDSHSGYMKDNYLLQLKGFETALQALGIDFYKKELRS